MRRTMFALGLGLSATILATGCQFGGAGADDGKDTKSTGSGKAQAVASPQASSGQPPVSKTVSMSIPGEQGQTFTLGFSSLKVKGPLATLTLVWTPHGVGTDTISPYEMLGQNTPGSAVTLIDTVNLKRYVIVRDSSDHELQSDYVTSQTGNNQPLAMSYTFAAPQANGSVNVVLGDRSIFESVPVTR